MATFTADRAKSTFPVAAYAGAGVLQVAYGSYAFTAEQNAGETLAACKVPKGAVILGGWLRMGDMDSNGTETIDVDVGWVGNADALGNFGVQTGDAVVGYLPEGGVLLPLHGDLATGPITLTEEKTIDLTFIDDAATFAAGTATVIVHYVYP